MYEFKRPRKRPSGQNASVATELAHLDEDQLYSWQERVAICVVHGGVSEARAQAIAWEQIRRMQEDQMLDHLKRKNHHTFTRSSL